MRCFRLKTSKRDYSIQQFTVASRTWRVIKKSLNIAESAPSVFIYSLGASCGGNSIGNAGKLFRQNCVLIFSNANQADYISDTCFTCLLLCHPPCCVIIKPIFELDKNSPRKRIQRTLTFRLNKI